MGRISCSPQLLGACTQNGIAVGFMTANGRFLAAVNGFTPGNVLLRREQYRRADDPKATAAIARACIIGKLSNYRTVLRRAVRDQTASDATARLEKIATRIDMRLRTLQTEFDVDQLRGVGRPSIAHLHPPAMGAGALSVSGWFVPASTT